jgi:glutathione S-transferase
LQLTIDAFLTEFDLTHPASHQGRQPEDQRAETVRRSSQFIAFRLPRLIRYLETVAERNAERTGRVRVAWMVGTRLSHVDLSVAQLIEGLRHALPRVSSRLLEMAPRLRALHAQVIALPRIRLYLDSGRRTPFDARSLFRHDAELDL